MSVLGIDVGASKIEAGCAGQPAMRAGLGARTKERELLDILKAMVKKTQPRAVGIALPGFVAGGKIRNLPNLPRVNPARLQAGLRRLPVPARIENDVKCMALAVWAGRGKRKDDDFLLVAPGSGTGGAIVREGRLVRGAHNTAGEVGHLKVRDGKGQWTDWEKCCSGFGIERRWKEKRRGRALSAREIFSSSDAQARRLVLEAADSFGAGLAGLANVLDPREIIVAGSVGKAFMKDARLRAQVRRAYGQNAIEPVRRTPVSLSKVSHPALEGAVQMGQNGEAVRRFLGR